MTIPGKYGLKPFAIGYQKDSPYAEMFDYHIEQMRLSGVLDKIKTNYSPLPQQCPDLRSVARYPLIEIEIEFYSRNFSTKI